MDKKQISCNNLMKTAILLQSWCEWQFTRGGSGQKQRRMAVFTGYSCNRNNHTERLKYLGFVYVPLPSSAVLAEKGPMKSPRLSVL